LQLSALVCTIITQSSCLGPEARPHCGRMPRESRHG
jgi:hypothetical protein